MIDENTPLNDFGSSDDLADVSMPIGREVALRQARSVVLHYLQGFGDFTVAVASMTWGDDLGVDTFIRDEHGKQIGKISVKAELWK